MKLEDFNIDLNKFQNETFQFTLDIDNTFFSLKENSLFDKGNFNALVKCTKLDATISIEYTLLGKVGAECERCLNPIEINLDVKFSEVYKITSDRELLETENYISDTEHAINTYDSMYENLCTHLPSRLICENSISASKCDIPINNTQSGSIDPRWDKLKKLIK